MVNLKMIHLNLMTFARLTFSAINLHHKLTTSGIKSKLSMKDKEKKGKEWSKKNIKEKEWKDQRIFHLES